MLLMTVMLPASLALAEGPHAPFVPQAWSVLPFVCLLLSIAIMPLLWPHIWEQHYYRVAGFWLLAALAQMWISLPQEIGFVAAYGPHLLTTLEEYISFIALLTALYTLTGGIHLHGNFVGTPRRNTALLSVGSVLASLIGTTGAAMLLIRPLIRANRNRKHAAHVFVFYIFLVCNLGGALTPIGDAPLFLGYLHGIPFFWSLSLLPQWALMVGLTLAVFYLWDTILAEKSPEAAPQPLALRVEGKINLMLLALLAIIIIGSGQIAWGQIALGNLGHWDGGSLVRDLGALALTLLSLKVTPKAVRHANGFSFAPVKEVAVLFVGIFATMVPALMLLQMRGGELGLNSPAQYFWVTGVLSSILDNAPTYMAFLVSGQGTLGLAQAAQMVGHPQGGPILTAISLGAVFMGANTYIGNGPNFMVKSIAERSGIPMPGFFGYMGYAAIVLLPLYALLVWIFF